MAQLDEGSAPLPPALARLERLKKRREFLRAASRGKRAARPGLVLQALAIPEPSLRLGFTVTKKIGNAVIRNRARRRLKEAARLTLPGMAAMALVLGMAIDANVLINERVREELRNGAAPQTAIHIGYDRAWSTILDSNVTTLIAGLALLAFGSGPVRGFAVVHCLGILTSMFSAVFFSRGLVNLWYGRQKRLQSVSIGTVWKPDAATHDVIAKAKAD
jgi:ribonuclease P protein component